MNAFVHPYAFWPPNAGQLFHMHHAPQGNTSS
jgi:hypothetical protein